MGAISELSKLLDGKVLVSTEITGADVDGVDLGQLAALVSERFSGSEGIKVLDKKALGEIIGHMLGEKKPIQVEVIQGSPAGREAKEFASDFEIRNSPIDTVSSTLSDFAGHFTDRFEKLRRMLISNRSAIGGAAKINNIGKYTEGRDVGVVGMVYEKMISKNGHVLVTLEDETGTTNVLFVKSDKRDARTNLFNAAVKILKDDVIAVTGKLSKGLLIANTLTWPDVPPHSRKQTEEDIAIAFVSDTHVGSKLFLEKEFGRMIQWLGGGLDYRKDIAGKVKYVVVGGDAADGVGVYPRQERELRIDDIYKQYGVFFEFLRAIPAHIEVFVMPGNHDGVRRAEPQPAFAKDFIDGSSGNIHLVTNPCTLKLHGMNVLSYHGTSLDSVISGIPGCSYSRPEMAMIEVLKRRHLASVYGSNVIVPSRNDGMVIGTVPDILHMGHVHKNGYSDYHGTLVVNSGTWQSKTSFQLKQGHVPTPAQLPVYETKAMSLSTLDFSSAI